MQIGKKVYFASDFHLGAPNFEKSLVREKKIVRWLDLIKSDASEVYLLGDIFDFWFEYKHVIPKGFVRLQGKIAELTDSGIPVHFYIGNHDMWMFDYFKKELGVQIHKKQGPTVFNNKKFYLGHGDGLGPGDNGYKFIKKIFANKLCQWLFARIHPNLGVGMANYWSRKSRKHNKEAKTFLGPEKEWLVIHCLECLKKDHYDYFIFGHRHVPIDFQLTAQSRYINLGDWISQFNYAVFDGEELKLLQFND